MLFLPPNKMWIGTDKIIVILDTNVSNILCKIYFNLPFNMLLQSTSCVTLGGHTRTVHSMIRVDNTVWSCSSDKTIRVWSEKVQKQK